MTKSKDANKGEAVPEQEAGKPLEGEATDLAGEEIPQVGKHPDIPADVPVAAGTALDPALPPPDPQEPKVE